MQTRSPLQTLLRGALLAATAALAVVNGLPVTPRFDSVSHVLYLFTRGSSIIGGDVLFYATSGVMAAMTLLIGGIPAAIYERIRGLQDSTPVSLGIWLVATALLALPALRSATGPW